MQVTDVDKVVKVIPRGSEMEVTVIDVQRLASETVTVYEPAIPVICCVVLPESHRYVYPKAPPKAVTVAVPSVELLQLVFALTAVTDNEEGSVMVMG